MARVLFCRSVLLTLALFSRGAMAASCDDLGRMVIDTMTITASETRDAGSLAQNPGPELSLPAHCRVAAVLAPSADSHIEMELWLPDDWNGKFLALGNGGWAGNISLSAMARGLQAGYAVASNDTGHKGASAAFGAGHPEKVTDFAWRAMHEMTVQAKTLIAAYYERQPRLSYFEGCSTGGRQGMMAAQRFPEDFDAIIAGAPVNNMLTLASTQMHTFTTLLENRSLALSDAKVALLHEAVLDACEHNDGVVDGFLNNPPACTFDPASLRCSGTDSGNCLTTDEIRSVRNAYTGVFNDAGVNLYPGHAKGFELGWRIPAAGAQPTSLQSDAARYLAHEDPDWNWHDFSLEQDLALVLEKAGAIEIVDTNLSAFKARGGKFIFYHGWNDPGPSPYNTINYYQGVQETLGGDQDDWLRLFMMPGMGHCSGGIGPDQADFLGAMEAWVEQDIAPEQITSARIREGRVDMTRPLCAFPAVAAWDGRGNPDDAASYACKAP